MHYTNTLIALGLILASSFLITNVIDKSYDFVKLIGYLLFYYVLIVLFSFLANKYLKIGNSKLIGSIIGLIISIFLWIMFGDKAKKGKY